MAANRLTEVCKNYLVAYDKLTGLYSRERFYEKAKELLRACPAMDFVVICSNIGSFKMINDIYGNQEGNALLCSLAARLRDMRLVHAVYGRLESDKFAICMSAAEYHASGFAQIYTRVSLPRHRAMSIMNYIGVYAVDDRTLPIGIMCDRAMMALNTLKGSYEKQVAYYDESLRQEILREQKNCAGTAAGLAGAAFRTVSAATGRCPLRPAFGGGGPGALEPSRVGAGSAGTVHSYIGKEWADYEAGFSGVGYGLPPFETMAAGGASGTGVVGEYFAAGFLFCGCLSDFCQSAAYI